MSVDDLNIYYFGKYIPVDEHNLHHSEQYLPIYEQYSEFYDL
jgi:hypothetical protein